ncbi:N-acetylglucosamine kinase [Streptomyces sp. NPDC054796]
MTGGAARADGGGAPAEWIIGVDSGGSGLRIALAEAGRSAHDTRVRDGHGSARPRPVGTFASPEPVRTDTSGIDAGHMLELLVPAARALLAEAGAGPAPAVGAVCVGAAGMASLGDGLRARLPGALAETFGARRIALAADAVTAYAGALGERPGAVVAAGTGLIAMGTDLRSWRRADGWGHLLGDCGGGAWIGRAGLEAAMRAYDGREGGSPALRERAEAVFGAPLSGLPGRLYPRTDRPAVLASFAPEVARCAAAEPADPVAERVMREAAREIAVCAGAVCPSGKAADIALTGGLFRVGEPLLGPLAEELAARLPHARTVEAEGDPLDGALLIAERLAHGALELPNDPTLLYIG